MKNILLVILLVFAVVAVHAQTGVIREFAGDVELRHSGSSVFVLAQNGSEVYQDTVISTGFRSTAIIAVGSTVITVQPLTRLTLAEISSSANTENLNVNLQAGKIRVDVKPPSGTRANTVVQSPSATASVRGTVYEMDVFNLNVIEGVVNWQDSNGLSSNIPAGFQGSIDVNGNQKDHIELISDSTTVAGPVGSGLSGESVGSVVDDSFSGEISIIVDWGSAVAH